MLVLAVVMLVGCGFMGVAVTEEGRKEVSVNETINSIWAKLEVPEDDRLTFAIGSKTSASCAESTAAEHQKEAWYVSRRSQTFGDGFEQMPRVRTVLNWLETEEFEVDAAVAPLADRIRFSAVRDDVWVIASVDRTAFVDVIVRAGPAARCLYKPSDRDRYDPIELDELR